MKNFLLVLVVFIFAPSAFSIENLPKTLEVLTNPAGPANLMEIEPIDFNKFEIEACTSLAKYNGDSTAHFGDQDYKLILVETFQAEFCPSDVDFKKYSRLVFHFKNVKFGNSIRLVLNQEDTLQIGVVPNQGTSLPTKLIK